MAQHLFHEQEAQYETQDKPVTVLGKTFKNNEERRDYFREELRKKLPELKKMEGFPIGEDEDIIELSDPPYYTTCPNPWLNDFIKEWEEEKKELEKQGKRDPEFKVTEPYAADVSEGKNNPIYMAHSYHTKVPHPAIMRYIMHYTQPGDIVFDGFAGTGMTGVAASMCANPDEEIKRKIEKENPNVKWGKRNAICGDLSPIASNIAANYNLYYDIAAFEKKAKDLIDHLEDQIGWVYDVKHPENEDYGQINYTVWSDVFICSNCGEELVFYDVAIDKRQMKVKKQFECTGCSVSLTKTDLIESKETIMDSLLKEAKLIRKQVPVKINYYYKNKQFEKEFDASDKALIEKINSIELNNFYPSNEIRDGYNTIQPKKSHGLTHLSDFYTKRNLFVLSEIYSKFKNKPYFSLLFTSVCSNLSSRLVRYNLGKRGNGILNGTLYISSLNAETNIFRLLRGKLKSLVKALSLISENQVTMVSSATNNRLKSDSVDYIFTDPPFGGNIMYSDLNLLWESWLNIFTNPKKEAIENKYQNKTILSYQSLVFECFTEFNRILKAGRWMTVEFSNTKASVWNGIQIALQNAGFIIGNVSALDKKQGSFKAVSTVTAVKQDLVISCYKPSIEFDKKFQEHQHTEVGVWDFVEEHLKRLPVILVKGKTSTAVIERSPKILYDRLISFYVQRNLPVPLDASDFQKGLKQRFAERDGMFFNQEQVAEYEKKKAEAPEFVQFSLFVANEQDAIQWLKNVLREDPKTESDLHPGWMKEVAGNMKKGDELPEMRTILQENFLEDEKGQWYIPDAEKESDLEKMRNKRLLKIFKEYQDEVASSKKKLKNVRTEALRVGFKQAYQDKDFKTIVKMGDRLPDNLLMEDEVLLQFYDIASNRI